MASRPWDHRLDRPQVVHFTTLLEKSRTLAINREAEHRADRLQLAGNYGRRYGRGCASVQTPVDRYSGCMSISVDDLRSLGAGVRAEAEATGELALTGPTRWDLPESVRAALREYAVSGAYEEAARACIAENSDAVDGWPAFPTVSASTIFVVSCLSWLTYPSGPSSI